jgi:hypothetical protein
MACALVQPDEYPDFMKNLIKLINDGNDEELKTCVCNMRSPKSADGCALVDVDKKLGLFPFCVTESDGIIGDNTLWPIGFTLKELMEVYWGTNAKMTAKGSAGCNPISHSFDWMLPNGSNPDVYDALPDDVKRTFQKMFLCNTLNKNIQPGVWKEGKRSPNAKPPNQRNLLNFLDCKGLYRRGERYIPMRTSINFYTTKYDGTTKLFYPQIGGTLWFGNGEGDYPNLGLHTVCTSFNEYAARGAGGTLTINGKSCNLYSTLITYGDGPTKESAGGISGNIIVNINNPISSIVFSK